MNAVLQTTAPALQTKPSLIGMSMDELRALVKDLGEPAFRAEQLHQWLYVHCVRDFEQMTNLKRTFKDKLSEQFQIGSLTIAEKEVSQDGTTKYLFRLADGKVVES